MQNFAATCEQIAATTKKLEKTRLVADYLKSLELRVNFRPPRDEEQARVAQLIQKTNQFNLSLRRRSEQEVRVLCGSHQVRVVSAADKFGDYGLVGVSIAKREGDFVALDSWLVSCRALGRGVEDAFLHGIAEEARTARAKRLQARYTKGPRNEPIKCFLEKAGFKSNGDGVFEMDLANPTAAPRHIAFEIEPAD